MTAPPGLIIFLNGTSSSGKSSIAAELLKILDTTSFHLPVDAFHAMRSKRPIPPEQLQDEIDRAVRGFHRAVAGMAAGGNTVVVDHVLSRPWRLADCLDLFAPEDVVLVGVHCPLPELERRERARGDRGRGLAAQQFARVHTHGVYDVECDTSGDSPSECAWKIKDFLSRRQGSTAFERLLTQRASMPAPAPTGS
ncbi:AAA family ATPase [Streptomyces sp. 21So2-11]|uniref:chloramphenicol phosphotransferase CPT family protein n=1 Tax=Streptomyces sp. 21So2-11 TaxID=3144408 RepID=UPI00321B1CF5